MSEDLSLPNPHRFGLASFAELLPPRDPIIGEAPGSFTGFHDDMMRALAPATPYECVIAENLIAIEWELLQHRAMRDASLRQVIRTRIRAAVVRQKKAECEAELDAEYQKFVEAGGDREEWEDPFAFDEEAAETFGEEIAARAMSPETDIAAKAYAEITELGLQPIDLMGAGYRDRQAAHHDDKIQDLERRRRDVKRDYDALQKSRPVEADVEDAEIIEG